MMENKIIVRKIIASFDEAYSLDCFCNPENQRKRDALLRKGETLRHLLLKKFKESGFSWEFYKLLCENANDLRIWHGRFCPVNRTETSFGIFDGHYYGEYALSQEGDFIAFARGINLSPCCYSGVKFAE